MEGIKWYVLIIGAGAALFGFYLVFQGLLARNKAAGGIPAVIYSLQFIK